MSENVMGLSGCDLNRIINGYYKKSKKYQFKFSRSYKRVTAKMKDLEMRVQENKVKKERKVYPVNSFRNFAEDSQWEYWINDTSIEGFNVLCRVHKYMQLISFVFAINHPSDEFLFREMANEFGDHGYTSCYKTYLAKWLENFVEEFKKDKRFAMHMLPREDYDMWDYEDFIPNTIKMVRRCGIDDKIFTEEGDPVYYTPAIMLSYPAVIPNNYDDNWSLVDTEENATIDNSDTWFDIKYYTINEPDMRLIKTGLKVKKCIGTTVAGEPIYSKEGVDVGTLVESVIIEPSFRSFNMWEVWSHMSVEERKNEFTKQIEQIKQKEPDYVCMNHALLLSERGDTCVLQNYGEKYIADESLGNVGTMSMPILPDAVPISN